MPFYEYQCKQCGHQLEAMQKVNDAPLKRCPDCGKPALQRLMSAPVFRLKGAGWYETDFKSDQEGKRNLVDKAEAEPVKDEKTDGKDSKEAKEASGKETSSKEAPGKEAPGKEGSGKDAPAAKENPKAAPKPADAAGDKSAGKQAANAASSKPSSTTRTVKRGGSGALAKNKLKKPGIRNGRR
ncbi:MAG: FmdB family zinc ribbon protein [Steroidobacteraceae bacterium]|jgi:putative FmdB family regulatory protein